MTSTIEAHLPKLIKSPSLLLKAQQNWTLISSAFFDIDVVDDYNLSCVCATVKVETASTFEPIKEYGSPNYLVNNYYKNTLIRKQLGNLSAQDAIAYCGRGFIQLTGRNNYHNFSTHIKHPEIMMHPDMLCEPGYAAKALAWYWQTRGLVQLCQQLKTAKPQYHRALLIEIRRKVNGGLNGLDEFLDSVALLAT